MLTQNYLQNAVITAMQAKASQAQAALQKGQSIEAAAAAAGGHVGHQTGMRAIAANDLTKTLGEELLRAMFGAKAGSVFIAPSPPLNGLVVGKIDAVRPADPSQVAQALSAYAQNDSKAYLEGLSQAAHAAAVKLVKPQSDLTLARQSIGVDQATIDRLSAKPKATPAGLAK
jgi:hypothetical protein